MQLDRRAYVCAAVLLFGTGCSSDEVMAPVLAPIEASFIETSLSPVPLTPLAQLTIPTYEGSGQAVHPDVIRFGSPWHGWEYWMAETPFPKGNEAFENPSILVSHDGLQWQVPAGLTNPLVRTPGKRGYNSDPDLSFDATAGRLVMVYREVNATHNRIWSTTSGDGMAWTKPVLLFQRVNHSMVSPAVTFGAAGTPMIWYVDAGPKSCSERVTHVSLQTATSAAALSPAAPERGWSTQKRNVLSQAGMNIWHIDATWIPERNEYWATYVAYPIHKCSGQDLFFARSSDGITWTTYSIPFLRHEEHSWTATTLYRASVTYDAPRGAIQFFVSGAAADKSWHLGYVDYNLASFVASLANGAPVLVHRSARAPDAGLPIEP